MIRYHHPLETLMIQHIQEILVDPATARQWLDAADAVKAREGFPVNRALSPLRVAHQAQTMSDGQFLPVGDLVRISFDQEFGHFATDGQHRLSAIIASGVVLPMLVWLNFPRELIHCLDGRGTRRPADSLHIVDHEVNVNILAALCNWVAKFELKVLDRKVGLEVYQIRELLQRHPDLRDWARELVGFPMLRPAYASASLYWVGKSSHPLAAEFIEKIKTGENLKSGSPVLALRNRIIEKRKEDFNNPTVRMIFAAWNLFQRGQQVKWLNATATVKWPEGAPYLQSSNEDQDAE